MFEIKKDSFYLNGEKFRLFSGAMHYFRIHQDLWEDRFAKMKAAGFNAVETVMCWNLHEPKEGDFDFQGMLDIERYCKTAHKYGLQIIIRPGPYTCGEWDNGGFPAWLLKDDNIRLRCNNKIFLEKVVNYYKRIFKILVPLEVQNGGNIIAYQIENEYGSYGNDKDYLTSLKNLMTDCGAKVPFFTSDGNADFYLSGGTLPEVYKTLNFGSRGATAFNCLDKYQKDMPKTCMEFWCGWFDHWGEAHHRRNHINVGKEIQSIIDLGANINIYMFHGGTNFNFWAGANYFIKYMPTVTSYDDAALLNEYGDYTKAYYTVREILHKAQNKPLTPLPERPKLQNIGEVMLTKSANLYDNLANIGEKHTAVHPESMEYFNQNFGYIHYVYNLKGYYPPQILRVEGVHDIAYLKINGQLVKKYDRTKNRNKKRNDGFTYKMPPINGEFKIEILVEGMGRINYGPETGDKKGLKRVILGQQILFNWEVYTLPMNNLENLNYCSIKEDKKGPQFLKGTFNAELGKDCFLRLKGFKKGFVTVNGFNLGRYWERGPQQTLYIPHPVLKDVNEIIVYEQEGYKVPKIEITDKHILHKFLKLSY